MAGKNKKNKKRRTDDYSDNNRSHNDGVDMQQDTNDDGNEEYDDTAASEVIPNGFTISFGADDFDDRPANSSRRNGKYGKRGRHANGLNGQDQVEDEEEVDSEQQAPRGGHGSQVLPVAVSLPEDHSGVPEDGHEYLFLVRREAAAHPGVITAQAFVRKDEMIIETSMAGPLASSNAPHRPSVEWRTSFLSRFSNMRQVMVTSSSQPSEAAIPPHYLPVPAAQDESSWRTYINGRKGKGKAREVTDAAPPQTNGTEELKDLVDGQVSTEIPAEHNEGAASAMDVDATTTSADMSTLADLDVSISTTVIQKNPKGGGSVVVATTTASEPRPPIPVLMRNLDHYITISLLDHFNGWLREKLENISEAAKPSTMFVPSSMARRKKKVDLAKPFSSTAPDASISTSAVFASAIAPVQTAAPSIPAALPTTPLILTALDSQWIFSLLTVLDPLLSSSEISILRTLAKTCQDIADFTHAQKIKWSNKNASERTIAEYAESIAGCWMINAAIWEVWGQRDLWEA